MNKGKRKQPKKSSRKGGKATKTKAVAKKIPSKLTPSESKEIPKGATISSNKQQVPFSISLKKVGENQYTFKGHLFKLREGYKIVAKRVSVAAFYGGFRKSYRYFIVWDSGSIPTRITSSALRYLLDEEQKVTGTSSIIRYLAPKKKVTSIKAQRENPSFKPIPPRPGGKKGNNGNKLY